MSGVVLSASVRQNLLALLASTQNDLATGNEVSAALDNPTNFFTAQGLNNRASDIANLLDGIGNGIQVLQAASTGLSSLQALVASAQSIAYQVLQAPTGYHTKSNVTSAAITGAAANNLLAALRVTAGTTNVTPASISGETLTIGATGGGVATNITFGTGAGQVSTLNELNVALAANNLQASIDTTGRINIVTTNDAASSTIGAIGARPQAPADPSLASTRRRRWPIRTRRARARTWSINTTTCWRKLTPRRRRPPSTASTS